MNKVLLLIILVTIIISTACGMKTVTLYGWEPDGPDRSIRVMLYGCDGGPSFELPVDTQCRVLRKTNYCGGHLGDDEDHIYMGLTGPWYKLECAGISGWLPVSQTR